MSFTGFRLKVAIERIEADTDFGAEIDPEAPLSESNNELLQGAGFGAFKVRG